MQKQYFYIFLILSYVLLGSKVDIHAMTPDKGRLADRRGSVVRELSVSPTPQTPSAQKVKRSGSSGRLSSDRSPTPIFGMCFQDPWQLKLIESREISSCTPASCTPDRRGSYGISLTPLSASYGQYLSGACEEPFKSQKFVKGRSPVVEQRYEGFPVQLEFDDWDCPVAANDGREVMQTPVGQTDRGQIEQVQDDIFKSGYDVIITPSEENALTVFEIQKILNVIKEHKGLKDALQKTSQAYQNLIKKLKELQLSSGGTKKKLTRFCAQSVLHDFGSPKYGEMRDFQKSSDRVSPIPELVDLGCAYNPDLVSETTCLPVTDYNHILYNHSLPETFQDLNSKYIRNKNVFGVVWKQGNERKTTVSRQKLLETLKTTANMSPLAEYGSRDSCGYPVQIGFYYDPKLEILMKRSSCCFGSTRITEYPVFSINQNDIEKAEQGRIDIVECFEKQLNGADKPLKTLALSKADIKELICKSQTIYQDQHDTIVEIGYGKSFSSLNELQSGQNRIEFYVVMTNDFYHNFIKDQLASKLSIPPGAKLATPNKSKKTSSEPCLKLEYDALAQEPPVVATAEVVALKAIGAEVQALESLQELSQAPKNPTLKSTPKKPTPKKKGDPFKLFVVKK